MRNRAEPSHLAGLSGLTLIEVVLALSLTVVIIGLFERVHGHALLALPTSAKQATCETAELASALMSLIVEDIRGVQVDYASDYEVMTRRIRSTQCG